MLIPLKLFFIWFWHQIQKPYKTTKTQGGRKLCLPLTLVDTASGRLFNLLLGEESRYQVYETKRHILCNMINTNRQILWYRENPVNDINKSMAPYLKNGFDICNNSNSICLGKSNIYNWLCWFTLLSFL